MKLGVIGAGGMRGLTWISTVQKLSAQFDLVGIAEVSEPRRKDAAARFRVPVFASPEEMLQKAQPTMALAAVPPDGNHAFVEICARHKVHVMTEIPIAPTRRIAEYAVNLAKKAGIKYDITENLHQWPHERLKQAIVRSGIIGPPQLIHLNYTSGGYHGFNGIRAIIGLEKKAKRVLGATGTVTIPFYEDYMQRQLTEQYWARGIVEFEGGVTCFYYMPPLGHESTHWEIECSGGEIVGTQLRIGKNEKTNYDFQDEWTPMKVETPGYHGGLFPNHKYGLQIGDRVLDHTRVDTPTPIVWKNPFKQYGIGIPNDLDEIARAQMLLDHRAAILEDTPVRYGTHNAWADQELVVAVHESARRGTWLNLPLTEETSVERDMNEAFKSVYGCAWDDIPGLMKAKLISGGRVRWEVLRDL